MSETTGPAELVLSAAVARRHYLQGQSKVDIAADLGISRFKVARLLESARASGMVRIEIARHGHIDPGLSAAVQQRWGLRHCVIVTADHDPVDSRRHLGTTAAELLTEIITPSDVLGLPWARSVADLIASVAALPPIPVVQLSGSLVVPGEPTSPVDLVRRAAQLAGGEAHLFYAPMLLEDEESARVLARQPQVAAALRQIPRVTIAVVGVGAWAPGASTLYDAATADDRTNVAASGAVGEAAGVFFDAAGAPVTTALGSRLVTLSAAQLLAIPEVIAVAYGAAKAQAVRASIAGGLVKSVVADTTIANALLAE